jgi:hypothetical protein
MIWRAGYASAAERVVRELQLGEAMPRLAQLVAASPLEAAIHDAYGKALGQNSYHVLGAAFANRDLSAYLTNEFAGEFLDRYTSRDPKPRMPLYHLVGALDPLTDGDLANPVDDGLPETLAQWILADGLTHLKIKLAGDDLSWDVQRVAGVEQVSAAAQQQRVARSGSTRWTSTRNVPASIMCWISWVNCSRWRRPRCRGCSTSSSRRIGICGPTRRIACTRRRRSSRW